MRHPRKAAAPPENGEARINHHSDSGPSSKQSQQRDSSHLPINGKATDSRAKVIEQAKRVTIGIPFHTTAPAKLAALVEMRNAHPGGSVRAQEDRLEMALRRWPLTFHEMWTLGLQDGRARIYGLKRRGFDITKIWVVTETDYGQTHRVALYSLQRGTTVSPALPPGPPKPLDVARQKEEEVPA